MRHLAKLLIVSLALAAVIPAVIASQKQSADPAALIHHAVEASDVWSTGAVRLRLHVKFMQVKAREVDADYEKVWISPKQWRAQLSSPEFNELIVGGDGRVWESPGTEKPLRVREFERAIAALSQTIISDGLKYSSHHAHLNSQKGKVTCVQVDDSQRPVVQDCFDRDTGLLLQVTDNVADSLYTYSDYKPFVGKLFPRTMSVIEGSTPVVIMEVVGLDAMPTADPRFFVPPPTAQPYAACPEALGFPLGAKGGKLIKRVSPSPPRLLPGGWVQTTVTVKALVGRDGNLHGPVALGLNKSANDAVLDAVRQWQYEPFTVCGNAVETPTSIKWSFATGP